MNNFIDITLIRENEDGSADFSFELSAEGKDALIRYGLMAMLKDAIAEGVKLDPKNDDAS